MSMIRIKINAKRANIYMGFMSEFLAVMKPK